MAINWRKPIAIGLLRVFNKDVLDELRLLRSIEFGTPQSIQELQDRRLTELLRHAWENTEYYRELLTEYGVVREGQVDLGNFESLPLLTKDVILREGPRLKAKALPAGRRPYVNRTGGSTGEPVEYWQDNYYWDVNVATKIYHFEVLGKEIGELEMKIWGSDRDIFMDQAGSKAAIKNAIYNRKIHTCSNLSEQDIRDIVADINKTKPKSVWGYVDGLYTIANHVNRHGLTVHPPAAVFLGGGTLLPNMADAIERAFRAPPINFYGSREMGDIACECAERVGLHLSSHSHRLEIVDENEKTVTDEDGDIIVTSLCNYTMPFVRYRIGDRGRTTAARCPCGRGFPLLESVTGRGMESFITATGSIVSPIYLITTIGTSFDPGFVKKLQIVQDDYSHVTLKMVVDSDVSQESLRSHLDDISQKLRKVMGPECVVEAELVDAVPPTKSGKYLYTVCNIPH